MKNAVNGMNRIIKIFLIIFSIVIVAIALILIKGFRDQADVKRMAAEFKPDLIEFRNQKALTSDQEQFMAACLDERSGHFKDEADRHEMCQCFAINLAHYVLPLMPSDDSGIVKRATQLHSNLNEISAKGAVVSDLCRKAVKK